MTSHGSDGPLQGGEPDLELNRRSHQTYSRRVTGAAILVCCFLFLGGIWISGIELENLIWTAGLFDPRENICLKTAWMNTTQGQADRVQLCTEWIDHSDMNGETHKLSVEELEIIKGGDGKVRAHLKRGINFRLVGVTSYLLIIIAGGLFVQRVLIGRYKKQMGLKS